MPSSTRDRLQALIGEWRIEILHQGTPATGRASFEWLGEFLIQHWETDPPFPSGIAIIGAADSGTGFTQHYFDGRGVARQYQMDLRDGTWTLQRDEPEDFSQRFTGTFDDDRRTITARWERSDDGSTWQHDFDMTYRKVG